MKLNERIRAVRKSKGWSQQDVARKLNMSLNAYGHIERGESHPNALRLEKIAQVFEMELAELVSDKNILNFGGTQNNHYCQNYYNDSVEQISDLQHELEKMKLINENQAKEIEYLKQQNSDLREMLNILKK